MTRRQLYALAFVALPLLYYLSQPIRDDDLCCWIALGLRALDTHAISRLDTFSALPTTDMIYPAGACVLYALLYRAGGLLAASLFHKLVLAGFLVLTYRLSLARLKQPWRLRSLVLVVAFFAGTRILYLDRPALLGFPLLVLAAVTLDRAEKLGWRRWVGLAGLAILWNNLHGSAALLVVMGGWRLAVLTAERLFFRDRRRGPWAAALAGDLAGLTGVAATLLVTPFGWSIFEYYSATRRLAQSRHMGEWASPALPEFLPQGLLFYALATATVALIAYGPTRARRLEILRSPFIPLLFLGFDSIRNTVLPFLVLLPLARVHGLLSDEAKSRRAPRPEPAEHRRLNLAIAASLVTACLICLPFLKPRFASFFPPGKSAVYDSSMPFRLAEYLRESNARGPVYNSEFGSFLMLFQPNRVFFDPRNTIYPDSSFDDYARIYFGTPDWQRLLDKYQARYLVLNRKAESLKLLHAVEASKRWAFVLADGDAVLYSRR
jgi:hypothetical protein